MRRPFGYWYGRLPYFRTQRSRRCIDGLKHVKGRTIGLWCYRRWNQADKLLDYLAGLDTSWYTRRRSQ